MKVATRFLTAGTFAALMPMLGACSNDSPEVTRTEVSGSRLQQQEPTVVAASGDIAPAVAQYRALLGEPNNGAALGERFHGRREITWDGVPAALTNTDDFPADGFLNRGTLFSTPGIGFRVSNNNLTDINEVYVHEFIFFSPVRTFIAAGSNIMDVDIFIPGSSTRALTTGFGVVFSDVDREGSTRLEFYDAAGSLLYTAVAPARSDERGLSFVGVVYDSPIVARVRIISGDGALGAAVRDISNGGSLDLVVMDDFLLGEPRSGL